MSSFQEGVGESGLAKTLVWRIFIKNILSTAHDNYLVSTFACLQLNLPLALPLAHVSALLNWNLRSKLDPGYLRPNKCHIQFHALRATHFLFKTCAANAAASRLLVEEKHVPNTGIFVPRRSFHSLSPERPGLPTNKTATHVIGMSNNWLRSLQA